MDESVEPVEQALGAMQRRDFLTKAAAAGAVAWVTPVILSRPAYADQAGGGTPNCRPSFTPVCTQVRCGLGNIAFPGFQVVGTGPNGAMVCPCTPSTPPGCPTTPTTCIRITNISACGSDTLVAYGNGTDCRPGGDRTILSTGCWVPFDASDPIFFGPPADPQAAINALGSSCCVRFTVAIWAGGCCDNTGSPAFTCQTFTANLDWNQNTRTTTCNGQVTNTCAPNTSGFTPAPGNPPNLCPDVNPHLSPCGTCLP